MTIEAAHSFYKEVRESISNHKASKSLEAVWSAILTINRIGGVINTANVARICEEVSGGPKEQSIRNDKLVKSRIISIASNTDSYESHAKRFDTGSASLFSLSNIAVLEAEISLLKADNRRMRAAFKNYRSSSDGSLNISPYSSVEFSKDEQVAVACFLGGLESEGLILDKRSGEIVRLNGRTFSRSGFHSALLKIVGPMKRAEHSLSD
ncbi:hypothetical protein [Brevundimonas nasdae]|uniref:hypothetical protein n=1 Tax=Brevundimonas nasdae TaxID=172043 RepID=UPI003F693236